MNPWLLLIGIVILAYLWFSSRGGGSSQRGVLSFGKSRAKEVEAETATFDDVAGVDGAMDELKEVVDFLRSPDRYASLGARIPKGVLLVGPPGTGKTLLARAVAGEAGVPFFQISGSEFVEMFVGVGAARVRDLFDKARKSAPCIIFIDELDAMGKARGSGTFSHEEREQTLNQLLVEMDGFDPAIGVMMMAATNRPEILDAALLRPGRFDRQIAVERPEREGRKQILEIHVRNVEIDPTVDLELIAARTPGFAGADLANLVNEAALLAARRSKTSVTVEEFNEAIERAMMGLEKKGLLLTPAERRYVAYHELGHAVVAEALPGADPVEKVTIVPRGMTMGVMLQIPTEDRYLLKASELRNHIAIAMGGRAAEMLFVGEPSTGAQSDLAAATGMASDMVRKYGMSELGTRTFERGRAAVVSNDMIASTPREHGAAAADEIDRAVQSILDEEMGRANAILKEHRDGVEKLVEKILEEQDLSGKQIREVLGLPDRAPKAKAVPLEEKKKSATDDAKAASNDDDQTADDKKADDKKADDKKADDKDGTANESAAKDE